MTALANLAKFQGKYDKFMQLRERYNLKWSKGDGLASFERFFNDGLNLEVMLRRVKEMMQKLPPNMAAIIKFDCMTGLRPSEAVGQSD
jgi:integrase